MSAFSAQPTSSPGVKNDDHGNSNGGTRPAAAAAAPAPASAFLGSMLFTRCVSGTRVVPRGQPKSVGGVDFTGYGASVSGYPHDYLTAACAVGLSPAELDEFLLRLDKALRKAKGDRAGGAASGESPAAARLGGGVNAGTAVSGQSPAAAELRGEDVPEKGAPAVAVVDNGLEKAEASSSVVGAEATAGHHAAQTTPNGRVAATTVEHHATQGTPEEVVVVASTAAEHHAEKNAAGVVVAVATAAGHHAAQAAQDTPGVEQSRVVPGTTDSDRFGGVSDSGVDARAMPKVSEALGLKDDDDWDAVD